jgi:hypothetical protein
VHRKPRFVGPVDQTGGPAVAVPWTHQIFPRTEHLRVRRHFAQPSRREQVVVGADELHQGHRGLQRQGAKDAGVERLDVGRQVRAGPAQGRE